MIVAISGPSGVGKTTVIEKVHEAKPEILIATPCTTRPLGPGERAGVDYHPLKPDAFESFARNDLFVEESRVGDYRYGVLKTDLPPDFADPRGGIVIFNIDVQGMKKLKEKYGPAVKSIFIMPPHFEALEVRLRERNRERSEEEIQKRLRRARVEICSIGEYDYRVVNYEIPRTVREIVGILKQARPLVRV